MGPLAPRHPTPTPCPVSLESRRRVAAGAQGAAPPLESSPAVPVGFGACQTCPHHILRRKVSALGTCSGPAGDPPHLLELVQITPPKEALHYLALGFSTCHKFQNGSLLSAEVPLRFPQPLGGGEPSRASPAPHPHLPLLASSPAGQSLPSECLCPRGKISHLF